MPEIAVAEMVCDWYARSQEFGNGLREWIAAQAVEKYQINLAGEQYGWVKRCVELVLEEQFVRGVAPSADDHIAPALSSVSLDIGGQEIHCRYHADGSLLLVVHN